MREWRVRDGLDFGHVEDPQIPLLLLALIQRVMLRAGGGWRGLAARRAIEHAAQPDAVHDAAMHATPHDATRAVVHHDEYSMGPQDHRLGARFRVRSRISNCCLRSTDSATTGRAPPGPARRAIVVSRWRTRRAGHARDNPTKTASRRISHDLAIRHGHARAGWSRSAARRRRSLPW